MHEAVFKKIDDILWKDPGCDSDLDYIEQTSWILFLKYLDDFESEKETEAILNNKIYNRIVDGTFRWSNWAVPKMQDGTIDYNKTITGDDLLKFINESLFPYLAKLKEETENSSSLKYKIGEIFSSIKNRLEIGYTIRDVIDKVDELKFLSNRDKHELSSLYEDKIKKMGNAGRTGGQYYTPRPLIQSIVKVINPKIGEKIYDGAVGSAGFLCEAYSWMLNKKQVSAFDFETLQKNAFFGKEKGNLAYVVGLMNMILHGIEAPNIKHTNTLTENITDIQDKDKVDVVLANPPFGGKERAEIQQNFPIKSGETAYLFLQHFIKILKIGGRCGVVIKNTFLSNPDASLLRKELLTSCNLFAILDLPKVFGQTNVTTVVLFFEKGTPSKNIFYYQLNLDRNIGLTNPLNAEDLKDFHNCIDGKLITKNSWLVNISDINQNSWDLSVDNPNKIEQNEMQSPDKIIKEIEELDIVAKQSLNSIKELL